MRLIIFVRMAFALVFVVAITFVSFILPSEMHDFISGKVTAQAYIYYTPPENCSVDLMQGINIVSFYCETLETPVNESLVGLNKTKLNYYAIFMYDSTNLNDSWSSYKPDLPTWATQSLNSISRKKGYTIIMNEQGMYYKEGYAYHNTQIQLYTGWNFIGYPTDEIRNVTDVLAQIEGKYTRVETYRTIAVNGEWLLYMPGAEGNLTVMIPMEGYWILMNESASLVVY